MIGRELRLRIFSAILLAIPVLALTWVGGAWFRVLAFLLSVLIFYEFSTITRLREREPTERLIGWFVIAVAGIFVLLGWLNQAMITIFVGAALAAIPGLRTRAIPWGSVAILYSGLFGAALAGLRGTGLFGLAAMMFIIAIVWATDIMAYFCGRALGGRKLAPAISPGKTWSGAIFGATGGVAAGLAVALTVRQGGGIAVPLIAFVLSVASQLGDLYESWVKRRFSVKDSSRLIPGHGGVMDRVDGLVFAVFAAFILAIILPTAVHGVAQSELAARLLGQ